jgi:acyl-CoA thioester hydrolase
MPSEYRTQRRMEFADTDMAGIVHFANFFRFMESVEHEFFRSLGCALHGEAEGRMLGFARVHAECDYLAPLHYAELVDVELRVVEIRSSTLSYRFRFSRAEDGRTAATGALTVCCVTREPGSDRLRPIPIPPHIAALVEVASPEASS